MATAAVTVTSDSSFSGAQLTSSNQGSEQVATQDPYFTARTSPAKVFKMRAWDTVTSAYVYWTSFGDVNTPAPTLNPVVGTTAVMATRPRTV
jgi:hypothetical protein